MLRKRAILVSLMMILTLTMLLVSGCGGGRNTDGDGGDDDFKEYFQFDATDYENTTWKNSPGEIPEITITIGNIIEELNLYDSVNYTGTLQYLDTIFTITEEDQSNLLRLSGVKRGNLEYIEFVLWTDPDKNDYAKLIGFLTEAEPDKLQVYHLYIDLEATAEIDCMYGSEEGMDEYTPIIFTRQY